MLEFGSCKADGAGEMDLQGKESLKVSGEGSQRRALDSLQIPRRAEKLVAQGMSENECGTG